MGKKSGPAPPAAPDPVAIANAQSKANREAALEAARLNQINEVNPFGTSTFSGELGSPDRTRTIALTPEAQGIFDAQQGISRDLTDLTASQVGRVGDAISTPFSLDGLPPSAAINDNSRQAIADSLLDRLEPRFARDEDALRTRLSNSGITLGSEAFSNAFDDFNAGRTDARLAALNVSGNELARDFGLQERQRSTALSESLLERDLPFDELSRLQGATQPLGIPQFGPTPQQGIAPPDVLGANALAQDALQRNFATQSGNRNAALGGLASLGAAGIKAAPALLALSDRRAKTDVHKVGKLDSGLPVYTFKYRGADDTQMGVMAQDVEREIPSAVHEIDAVKFVDYEEVGRDAMAHALMAA